MLLTYIGSVELGDGLAIKFKVTEAARTVTDLASQYVSIDGSDHEQHSRRVIPGHSALPFGQHGRDRLGSDDQRPGPRDDHLELLAQRHPARVGASVTLPTALQTANISLIWGEVTYPYTPQLGYVITGTVNIYQSTYFYPRLSSSVACKVAEARTVLARQRFLRPGGGPIRSRPALRLFRRSE